MNNSLAIRIKRFITSPVVLRVLAAVFAFFSSILVNRSIGLELKGQYTTVTSYANYGQMLLNLGICFAYPVLLKKTQENWSKKGLLTIIWIQSLLCLIIAIFASFFIRNESFVFVFLLTAFIICNGQISFLALIDNIKARNIVLLASSFLHLLLNGLVFFFFKGNLRVVLIFLLVKNFVEVIVFSILNKYFQFSFKEVNSNFLKVVFSIGVPTAIMNLLISVNYSMDVLMLNLMKSTDVQIGIYGVAYSLSSMLWIIPDSFKEMVYNKSVKNNDYRYVFKYLLINIGICLIVLVGFIFLGQLFLKIVYGDEFVVSYSTVIVLLVGIMPMVAFKLIHPIYVNSGKSFIVGVLLVIAVIVNVVSSFFLIPPYGAFGAAIATVISYSVCGLLFFFKFSYDYIWKLRVKNSQFPGGK